ncbi:F-box/LRR-repeat protein 14 [Ananas comosus]|uniref:F-box/LRR-repeat protein 14 n=1 Tax=Ananas comosus TaxID=4615 RepID=A0A6P5FAA2_ANACO|nr:F-box/LRR-repeat protein 14 [Ananas comosus]
MEDLPEPLLLDITKRITRTSDRNSLSLASKRLHAFDAEQREFIRVGCGLHPATDALTSLCIRFPNLTKVEIVYSGWMSHLGKQIDNRGLLALSSHCPALADLTLSFCSFVSDAGLGHLASCKKLTSLELNFAPAISSNGVLSVVVGCKSLSALRLVRCMKVNGVGWLEYVGKFGSLKELAIKNCRAVGEDDLIKLGTGWNELERFEFEMDSCYRCPKVYDLSAASDGFPECRIQCENLTELRLTNCVVEPGRVLSHLLGSCDRALEKLRLETCIGTRDRDMIALSRSSKNLRSIALRLPLQYLSPCPVSNASTRLLTDDSLIAFASECSMLEEVELSFVGGDFPNFCCFTLKGISTLIQSCPIRVLVLNNACFFDDAGMEALVSAAFLETLELAQCQEVSDVGMRRVVDFPRLAHLRLCRCLGVTDLGLKAAVDSKKLESLVVEDCPQISEEGVRGAARSVSYAQDSAWLY